MPIPVLSIAQMRRWEAATWASGTTTEEAVIRRVGQRLARRVLSLTRSGDGVLILAGRGHNGDDARCAVPHLTDRAVQLVNVDRPETVAAEVSGHLARRPALVIDGLFGIGLSRPLDASWVALVEHLNGSGSRVLAVDVPSGLNADTGEVMGAAVRAETTLTLGAPKSGLLATRAAPWVGRLEVEPDIGLVRCPESSDAWWVQPEDFTDVPWRRPAQGHKGMFGHLAILAGSCGYHGAAVLAARGAQAARPGLISLYTAVSVYLPVAAQLQAVMVHPWTPGAAWPAHATALLVGPGLAAAELPPALRETVGGLWRESPLPMLADASALGWLPDGATPAAALRVVTPHPGEAARLLGSSTAAVQADRRQALREVSARLGGCWVVLKGQHTLVGRAEGSLSVNSSGSPSLAQGGSGDVLAGYLAGLLAQPQWQHDPGQALRFGVWQHGAAADALDAPGTAWVIEALPTALGRRHDA